ncbi:MAG: hypothetical protein WKF89_05525 [Chitinophagaceae bacterium]
MMITVKAQAAEGFTKNDQAIYLTLLREAMQSGETFIIKVHAAEALINNNYTEGIDSVFSLLIQESPSNLFGASRVLARVNKNDPGKYENFVNKLLAAFLHADSVRGQLIALESLAKLGYCKPLDEINRLSNQHGENGLKGMARWILSNSDKAADEARLAELLTSDVALDYRYAAYALRFFKKIRSSSYNLLEACNKRVVNDDAAKVYILSTLFVHAGEAKSVEAKANLLTYLDGAVNERYEVAEALSLKGSHADIGVLQKLFSDENMDVRVAAANALLKMSLHSTKKQ